MRLYNTVDGIAREDSPGTLSLVELPYSDLGGLLRQDDLELARGAAVKSTHPIGELSLRAPVPDPGTIVIAGLNYPSHAEEARGLFSSLGRDFPGIPAEPSFQVLPITTASDPGSAIRLPVDASEQVDYEAEVTIVIGRTADNVSDEEAWNHVAGLTIANDVSARDIQLRAMTGDATVSVAEAKSFSTFKPMGPCLVTADEFAFPIDLRLQTRVNGELRQDDRTGNLLFDFAALVAFVSRSQRLEPGDVILTGTPSGAGAFSDTYLTDGDVVEIEVERIGVLSNTVKCQGTFEQVAVPAAR